MIAAGSAAPVYLDSCVVLSLFLGDSGYCAAEQWLLAQADHCSIQVRRSDGTDQSAASHPRTEVPTWMPSVLQEESAGGNRDRAQ